MQVYVILDPDGQHFYLNVEDKSQKEVCEESKVSSKYLCDRKYGMPTWVTGKKWDQIMRMHGEDFSKSLEFAKNVDLIMFCMDMKGDSK